MAKIDALRPDSLICNNCQHSITDIHEMPTKGMDGIEAAFAGICPNCKSDTYAIKGDPIAVAQLSEFLREQSGGRLKTSMQPIPPQRPAD